MIIRITTIFLSIIGSFFSFSQEWTFKKNGDFEYHFSNNKNLDSGKNHDAYFHGTYSISGDSIYVKCKPSFIVTKTTSDCINNPYDNLELDNILEDDVLVICFQMFDIRLGSSVNPKRVQCIVNERNGILDHIDESNVAYFYLKKKPNETKFKIDFPKFSIEGINLECKYLAFSIKVEGATTTMGLEFEDCVSKTAEYKGKVYPIAIKQ